MRYLFFITVFSTLLILAGYTTWRCMQAVSIFGNTKFYILGASTILFITLIVAMVLETKLPLGIAKNLAFVGFSYLLVLVYFFIGFILLDLTLLFNKLLLFIPNIPTFRFASFLLLSLIISAAMLIGNYKFNHPKVVKLEIQTEKPQLNKQLKIVGVSDLHIGTSIGKKKLQRYVDLINEHNPDLVLIAGDLVDREMLPVEKQNLHEDLVKIKSKLGVFAVLGNHEHYSGDLNIVKSFYKNSNIHLLSDEALLLNDEILIVGRDDKTNLNRKDLAEITSEFDLTKPTILLDHQPFHLNDAEDNNIDFQLSGHTHNGQFFPGNLVVKRMYEKGYGYLKKGNTHIYVSSGLGIWGPQYRIGTQSELVVIDFKY